MLANSKTGDDLRQRLNADFHRLFGPKSGRPFKWPGRIAPAPTLTDTRRRSILNAMKIGARAGARKKERAEWSTTVKEAEARKRRWDYYMSYHWEFGVYERPKSILEGDPAYAEAIMSGAVEPGWTYAFDDDVQDDEPESDSDARPKANWDGCGSCSTMKCAVEKLVGPRGESSNLLADDCFVSPSVEERFLFVVVVAHARPNVRIEL
jgi:hypothetical protein